MKIDFYGTKIDPPTKGTVEAFGRSGEPILLAGGQGTSYRVADIVLKPAEDNSRWIGDIFEKLPESNEVRFGRPIRTVTGEWIKDGYVAWTFLKGRHADKHYSEKVQASIAFHQLLKGVPKPWGDGDPSNSWAAARAAAWGKRDMSHYDPFFLNLINQIVPKLKPLDLPGQLIHGDLSGNFLIEEGLAPAIIDFALEWNPNGFAEGIMMSDVLSWEDADIEDLKPFKAVPHIEQLAWRGVITRIAEQAEHITWLDKDREQAIYEARMYQNTIDTLKKFFAG